MFQNSGKSTNGNYSLKNRILLLVRCDVKRIEVNRFKYCYRRGHFIQIGRPSLEVSSSQSHQAADWLSTDLFSRLMTCLADWLQTSGKLPFTVKMGDFREFVQFIINYNNLKESRSNGK